jgi:apolipoprotein N-acyltransferase
MLNKTIAPIKKEFESKKLDLIILPEDMIDIEDWNGVDDEAKNKFNIESGGLLIQAYRNLAKELNANLMATFTTHQNGKTYNTTILFNRDGEIADIYNKSRLTFSSEYWPFGDWQPFYYKWLIKLGYNDIVKNNAVFDKNYRYEKGEGKILKIENNNVSFIPLICLEAHYPDEIKKKSNLGADFIVHTSSNRWIADGTKHFMKLTNNLRKIEAVWLKKPVVFNGREENAGIILPNGKTQFNYDIFIGEIKY